MPRALELAEPVHAKEDDLPRDLIVSPLRPGRHFPSAGSGESPALCDCRFTLAARTLEAANDEGQARETVVASEASYPLGSSDAEHERLMFQARVLRPWTSKFLSAGGLRPGMSVLDLGSGIGDVALLAAEIVGPQGRVLGIDRDERVVDKARRRVASEGLAGTVSFEVADLGGFRPAESFDAVIGRYVLLYLDDPAAVLRHYARFLRPGGVVIFHEIDMTNSAPSWPPCPVWDDTYQLMARVFDATGAVPGFGGRMSSTYLAAGLPRPTVEAVLPVIDGPDSPVLDWAASTIRSVRPVLDRIGASLPPGLDYDSLAEHWRKAIIADGVQIQGPPQYGAWTRVP
jgi:ubiquinone/menaquinone biosynthesis C-methylase UbiE